MLEKPPRGARKRERAALRREEARIVSELREYAMARDRTCRAQHVGVQCDGPLEMAHLEDCRRAKTGGRAPGDRHKATHVVMLCRRHHFLYDSRRLTLVFESPTLGANGLLTWTTREEMW